MPHLDEVAQSGSIGSAGCNIESPETQVLQYAAINAPNSGLTLRARRITLRGAMQRLEVLTCSEAMKAGLVDWTTKGHLIIRNRPIRKQVKRIK